MRQKGQWLTQSSQNTRKGKTQIHEKWKGTPFYIQESVFNELKVLRSLEHKNLMKLYEVYEDSNKYYFILELLHGVTLYKEIAARKKKNNMPPQLIRTIVKQIL